MQFPPEKQITCHDRLTLLQLVLIKSNLRKKTKTNFNGTFETKFPLCSILQSPPDQISPAVLPHDLPPNASALG